MKWVEDLCTGRKTVLWPERHGRELDGGPGEVREKLKFVWVAEVDNALAAALSDKVISEKAA